MTCLYDMYYIKSSLFWPLKMSLWKCDVIVAAALLGRSLKNAQQL